MPPICSCCVLNCSSSAVIRSRSGGVAGRRAHRRQPATRCTVKRPSRRAPLHPQTGRGQAWKGQSARRREKVAYLRGSLRSTAKEQPKPVPGLEARVGGAESNHATRAADRDRCTAVDMPKGDPPDTLSARQAYGNPPYRGPGAGRQAAAQGARGERAPPVQPTTPPRPTLPAGSPPPYPPY